MSEISSNLTIKFKTYTCYLSLSNYFCMYITNYSNKDRPYIHR